MSQPDLLARLKQLGPPIFVTDDDDWRVVGVEGSRGKPDAVLVFSRNGGLTLRTERLSREAQPTWVNVKNMQMASVHRPDATPAEWDAVTMEVEQTTLVVDDVALPVPVLRSRQTPSLALTSEVGLCTLEFAGRRLVVAGCLQEFRRLRVKSLYDLEVVPR